MSKFDEFDENEFLEESKNTKEYDKKLDDVTKEYYRIVGHGCFRHREKQVVIRQTAHEPFWNQIFTQSYNNQTAQIERNNMAEEHAAIKSDDNVWDQIKKKFGSNSYTNADVYHRADLLAREGKFFKFCEECGFSMLI